MKRGHRRLAVSGGTDIGLTAPTDFPTADGAGGIVLPDGRTLWLYGDKIAQGQMDLGTHFQTVDQKGAATPLQQLAPNRNGSWFWPLGGAFMEKGKLYAMLGQFKPGGSGSPMDIGFDHSVMAELDPKSLQVRGMRDLPADGVQWGSSVIHDGGHTYMYGIKDVGGKKSLRVAQTPLGQASTAPLQDLGERLPQVGGSVSVVRNGKGFQLVTQQDQFGSQVHSYASDNPAGNWHQQGDIYQTPDQGQGNYSYNAQLHPGGLLSYAVAGDPQKMLSGQAPYGTRFYRLPGYVPPRPVVTARPRPRRRY